ncbi:MAG: hypothetical protein AW07_03387 [Candidatus Accumulibacter sp. SK-11]|nr:MAG: hypothetical protein AW07_03387 [Candidatus Accumulibacter sp. SK-11]
MAAATKRRLPPPIRKAAGDRQELRDATRPAADAVAESARQAGDPPSRSLPGQHDCYHRRMNAISPPTSGDTPATAAPGWLPMLHAAMLQLAAALSPSVYTPEVRHAVASRICSAAAQAAPRFLLLTGLLSQVIVHIVVVTAQSYGLSQFALSMVIRVLVVELLPLAAALFVALRLGADTADASVGQYRDGLAGVVSRFVLVIVLATGSGAIALVIGYLSVYGVTPWGFDAFTRTVGQVFDPLVLMALALKTLLFAASVATLSGTTRLFALLIAVESLLLVAEFF